MDIRSLKTFITAAEKMNFSKTAEALGYTQSAVTIQIQKLEQELGVQLFERIGKRIYLTGKGHQFLQEAQDIVYRMDRICRSMHGETDSSEAIRIGLSESLLSMHFQTILLQFQKKHPCVHFLIQTGVRDRLYGLMMRNELDMAFIIDRNIIDQEWNGEILGKDTAYFVASTRHPLAERKTVTIEDLQKEKIILTEHNFGYTYELLQILATKKQFLPCQIETGNTDFIRSVLLTSDYVSFLPEYVIEDDLEEGKLCKLPVNGYHAFVYRQIFWHKSKYLTPAMQQFLNLIRNVYGKPESLLTPSN